MNNHVKTNTKHAIEISIRLGALFLLLYYCFEIIAPFIKPVLWAIIFAVALYPIHKSLQKILKGKTKLAATLVTIGLLAIIFIPAGLFISSVTESIIHFIKKVEDGTVQLNTPSASIQTWPLIGEPLYNFLKDASGHLTDYLSKYETQILSASKIVLNAIIGTGLSFLQVIISIVIAGVLLATKQTEETSQKIYEKIVGEKGLEYLQLTGSTIRAVVKGVLGVAVVQAALCGVGFYFAGIPSAAILTLLALILAIVQLGPGILLIGSIIYLHATGSGFAPTIWTIYFIAIMFSDNILKPFLLGKGAQVPILVVFIGVTGGFLLSGFIGLFSGPIILSVGYKLFLAWLNENVAETISEISSE